MRLQVEAIEFYEAPYRLRLPFRFGVVTVTEGVQVFVQVRIRLASGARSTGYAAEALAAKWFDKRPHLSDEDNRDQLRLSLAMVRDTYLALPMLNAFDVHAYIYHHALNVGAKADLPALVSSYGMALIDRAIVDALCRSLRINFVDAVQHNVLGLRSDTGLTPDLKGFDISAWLRTQQPRSTLQVRHTIGLLDPITPDDVAPEDAVLDGLPHTLQDVIACYGHRYFKIKISGQPQADLLRLRRIAQVLDSSAAPYHVTLDGNEQFIDAACFADWWQQACAEPQLQRLTSSTLFIEQPLHRQCALHTEVPRQHSGTPWIIDESDGDMHSFLQAVALGYQGVSTKSCKGIYKSLLNAARCVHHSRHRSAPLFMSAEDLTMQPGTALQQDLALVSLLGITHVERNAHHYIHGFNGQPAEDAQAFALAHPDLYTDSADGPRLRITQGQLPTHSCLQAIGFGSAIAPSVQHMQRSILAGVQEPTPQTPFRPFDPLRSAH